MPYLRLKLWQVSAFYCFFSQARCLWQAVVRDLRDVGLTRWTIVGVHPGHPGLGAGAEEARWWRAATVSP